jgi:hypothetical protein
MGLDGLALDEDEDAMRLGYILHKASGFDIHISRPDVLRFAFEHGRFAVTGKTDGGRLIGTGSLPNWWKTFLRSICCLLAPTRSTCEACSSLAAKLSGTVPSPVSTFRRLR